MHDQPSFDTAADQRRADFAVLNALLTEDAQAPWTVEEVAREVGSKISALDALDRLYSTGLVHRLNGFVFASRAAVRFERLTG